MKRVACALLLTFAAAPVSAESRLELDLQPRSATVGDPIEVRLTLHLDAEDAGATAIFPDWSQSWGELRTEPPPPPERRPATTGPDGSAGIELTQIVRAAAYRVGRHELPALTVRIEGPTPRELHAGPISIEIRSVIADSETEPAPRPPAPPRALELPAAFAWTVAALSALALFGAVALARRRKLVAAAAVPAPPPGSELESALDSLDGADPVADHARLSLALRRYLGRTLSLPALALSTSEIARRLDSGALDRTVSRRAVRLLRETDGVKFARQGSDRATLLARIAAAREIATAVELSLHPPAPAGTESAAA